MTRQHRRQRRDDGAFDRTDVRYDGALLERRGNGPADRLIGADWRAQNDAIGGGDGASQIVGDNVSKLERLCALQNSEGLVGKNDAPGGVAIARGAGAR
jgi:hypothetical protein